jgi:hypothetical protein
VIDAGGQFAIPEPLAAPCVQFSRGFDDHGSIVPGRRNERNPRPWKPKFSQSQLSNEPPIMETSGKTAEIILDLTRPMPMLLLMRGRATPAVETKTPNEETRR